jgi:hypothetical protein
MFKWGGVGIGSSAYALLLKVVYNTISLQNYKVLMLIHKQHNSSVTRYCGSQEVEAAVFLEKLIV